MQEGNQLRVEEEERAALLSDVRYDVWLSLDGEGRAPVFDSRTAIDFTCAVDDASTFINLRAPEPPSVVLNGQRLSEAQHAFDGCRLALPGLRAGPNRVEVQARCAYQDGGVGLHRFRDPADQALYHYTNFEPFDAHRVLACFDQPSLKATMSLHLETPSGWTVCGNAPVERSDRDGERTTWHFATTPPLPPYLFALAAGEYEVIDGPPHRDHPLRLMCRRSLASYVRDQAGEIFDVTSRGLAYFERRYGHDYPFGTYTQVFVPEATMGAMENPGCVTFNEMFVFRGRVSQMQTMRRAIVTLHEMVHVMGFGDVVTMRDWGDLWLNETFATVEATIAADALGIHGAWVDFAGPLKSRALGQDQLSTTHPILVDAPDTDSVRANFDGITYHKGAAVLRQLIAWVGDEQYAAGIRSYFAEFSWRNATRADFLAHQSRQSGRDLDSWARLWLETPGANTVAPRAGIHDGHYTEVALGQLPDAAAGVLRPHRVKASLYDRDGDDLVRRGTASVELTGSLTAVPSFAGVPAADLLIGNDDDLTYAKLRFDARSLATLLDGGLAALAAARTRSLCWTALHDMARDAELPAREFVDAVIRQAPRETDEILLERILSLAVEVADSYGSAERRPIELAAIARTAAEQMSSSRTPLVWVRCLAATARDSTHLAMLQSLLDGDLRVAGVDVDVELRWLALARLATAGRAGAPEIDAALELDATDAGRRRAIACLAARPSAEAKQEVWAAAVEDGSVPRARVVAMLSGFSAGPFAAGGVHAGGRDQLDVTRPLAARYLEAVPALWAERDVEMARVVTEGLFPREPADDATVAAANDLIDRPGLSWNCRRILMEGRDRLVRARAARAADS